MKTIMSTYGAENLSNIFCASVDVVKPENTIKKHLQLIDNGNNIINTEHHDKKLQQITGIIVDGTSYQICTANQDENASTSNYHGHCYNITIIGFGKAVVGMASALIELLSILPKDCKERGQWRGILLVPHGSYKQELESHSWIEVIEGAKDNIPDEDAFMGAKKIYQLAKDVRISASLEPPKRKELIIFCISGGGSALLTYPIPPITLTEKSQLVSELSKAGANICELNKVRMCLSMLKGGKLAQLARPAEMCSLILSDVIGDPLNLIASGPTVLQNVKVCQKEALNIISRFAVSVPYSVKSVLNTKFIENHIKKEEGEPLHVNNVLFANNRIALTEAALISEKLGYEPYILSSEVGGIASKVGRALASLAHHVLNKIQPSEEILAILSLDGNVLDQILTRRKQNPTFALCLIAGGETVVEVNGNGKGGRNQELALAAALQLDSLKGDLDEPGNIIFLSAGTDGIDGPTDAAGAVVDNCTVNTAMNQGLNAKEFLQNNDSYNFFLKLNDGEQLIKTGHTGTNVMDIQLLLIQPEK